MGVMANSRGQFYFFISATLHSILLLCLVLSMDFAAPLVVFENTNKQDVISAVVLGDTAKSKILPKKEIVKPIQKIEKTEKETPPLKTITPPVIEKNVIALKPKEKKKPDVDLIAKNLLADIEKEKAKPIPKKEKVPAKQLSTKFEKLLREQAEQSLRQQLLNEDIILKGMETRQSQGEINKYKALILQAISEQWIVPTQANKKLYCELLIRVAPGGMVLDVQVTKSSGDPSLDSSARAAVLKASPLPVPNSNDDFEPFRRFVLKVKPENVVVN